MQTIKMLMIAALTILSASVFAQDTTTIAKQETEKATYMCPMHPNVIMDKAGKCPKCGMALTEKKADSETVSYSCSVHSNVVSEKPGTCPK